MLSFIWIYDKDCDFDVSLCVQVHDFGFFRYDPGAIQFLNYEEIPLAPEAACVGLEIRVVGNDSGEKVIGCMFVIYFYLFGVLLHLQWKNGLGFLLFFV